MIAKWQKTFYQDGLVDVPDNLNEEDARQFIKDAAAASTPTVDTGGPNDIDWAGSDFFRPADEEHEPCFMDIHTADGQIVTMSEWFDI